MRAWSKVLAIVLMVLMGLTTPMNASADESLLTRTEIDEALRRAFDDEAAARENVRTFLNREDVRRIAAETGLGPLLAQAVTAVETLEPEELERVSARVGELNDELAGGLTITISLVALLLIIIIIILLVD